MEFLWRSSKGSSKRRPECSGRLFRQWAKNAMLSPRWLEVAPPSPTKGKTKFFRCLATDGRQRPKNRCRFNNRALDNRTAKAPLLRSSYVTAADLVNRAPQQQQQPVYTYRSLVSLFAAYYLTTTIEQPSTQALQASGTAHEVASEEAI